MQAYLESRWFKGSKRLVLVFAKWKWLEGIKLSLHSKKNLRENNVANVLNSSGQEIMETDEKLNNNQKKQGPNSASKFRFFTQKYRNQQKNKSPMRKHKNQKNQRVIACIFVF